MPEGWSAGRFGARLLLRQDAAEKASLEKASSFLRDAVNGEPEAFSVWIRERTARQNHPFERAMLELDLEAIETLKKVDVIGQ